MGINMWQKELIQDSRNSLKAHLSNFINNLPGIIFRGLNDHNRTIEFISEECYNLTKYRPEDLVWNRIISYSSLIHPDDVQRVWSGIQESLYDKKEIALEYRIRTADGQDKWVWEKGHGFFDEFRGIMVLEGMIIDITRQKELEKERTISESKYRSIFEGSQDMIFISSIEGKIKDVNQACVNLLKYQSKEDIISLSSMEEIYFTKTHWKVFQKQLNLYGYVREFEAQLKKRDGTNLHCLLSGNILRAENGNVLGYESIAKDITARVDATRNLFQRHRELQLLNSIALVINRSLDLDDLLKKALKQILTVLKVDSGGIFLINLEKSAFELRCQMGLAVNDAHLSEQFFLMDNDLMEALLKENIVFTPEASFPPFRGVIKDKEQDNSLELTCFLISANNMALGFFGLQYDKEEVNSNDLRLMGALGNFLGGAIQKAQLMETVHRHRKELRQLTAKLFQSQDEERKKISQELHDEAGQYLTGINFQLEALKRELTDPSDQALALLAEIKNQITTTYEGIRDLSRQLHPAILSDLGLEAALRCYFDNVSAYSNLKIDFNMIGFNERMDVKIETVLYRCAQEALNNVCQHSKATHFWLSIVRSFPYVIFQAIDNGVGFDTGILEGNNGRQHNIIFQETENNLGFKSEVLERNNSRQHIGLLSMRERVAMLGGSFSIHSSPGKGTKIYIKIHLSEVSYV